MDRRHFIGLSGIAAALLDTSRAEAAPAFAGSAGKTVADFGVMPDPSADQSPALQKAIGELTAAGQPVVIPAGRYRAARLQLPSGAVLLGVPGLTVLSASQGVPVFESLNAQDISLRGLAFSGIGLFARNCTNLTVSDCQILSSAAHGLVCSGTGLFIAANRAAACAGSAIWVEGDGMVTNNMIAGQGQFGLRLGTDARLGTLTVINNRIEGTNVGIGVSNSDKGYAFITMNMIAGAKEGGIRALSGEKLIGRDLTQGGSEAFRNLAIAANVSI
jgi:Pectate lyase superfamily protein